jgi:hypothetical protein
MSYRGATALIVIQLVGCGISHGADPIAGVAADERMVDLNDSEWAALCGWFVALRGSDLLQYNCVGAMYLGSTEPHGGCGCDVYDWRPSMCASLADSWRTAPRDCATTVGEWASVWAQNAEAVCWYPNQPWPAAIGPVTACAAQDDAGVGADR